MAKKRVGRDAKTGQFKRRVAKPTRPGSREFSADRPGSRRHSLASKSTGAGVTPAPVVASGVNRNGGRGCFPPPHPPTTEQKPGAPSRQSRQHHDRQIHVNGDDDLGFG